MKWLGVVNVSLAKLVSHRWSAPAVVGCQYFQVMTRPMAVSIATSVTNLSVTFSFRSQDWSSINVRVLPLRRNGIVFAGYSRLR